MAAAPRTTAWRVPNDGRQRDDQEVQAGQRHRPRDRRSEGSSRGRRRARPATGPCRAPPIVRPVRAGRAPSGSRDRSPRARRADGRPHPADAASMTRAAKTTATASSDVRIRRDAVHRATPGVWTERMPSRRLWRVEWPRRPHDGGIPAHPSGGRRLSAERSAPADRARGVVRGLEDVVQLEALVRLDGQQDRRLPQVHDDDPRRPIGLQVVTSSRSVAKSWTLAESIGVRSLERPRRPSMRTFAGRVALTPFVAMNASMRSRARSPWFALLAVRIDLDDPAGERDDALLAGEGHGVRRVPGIRPAVAELDVEGRAEARWRVSAGRQARTGCRRRSRTGRRRHPRGRGRLLGSGRRSAAASVSGVGSGRRRRVAAGGTADDLRSAGGSVGSWAWRRRPAGPPRAAPRRRPRRCRRRPGRSSGVARDGALGASATQRTIPAAAAGRTGAGSTGRAMRRGRVRHGGAPPVRRPAGLGIGTTLVGLATSAASTIGLERGGHRHAVRVAVAGLRRERASDDRLERRPGPPGGPPAATVPARRRGRARSRRSCRRSTRASRSGPRTARGPGRRCRRPGSSSGRAPAPG